MKKYLFLIASGLALFSTVTLYSVTTAPRGISLAKILQYAKTCRLPSLDASFKEETKSPGNDLADLDERSSLKFIPLLAMATAAPWWGGRVDSDDLNAKLRGLMFQAFFKFFVRKRGHHPVIAFVSLGKTKGHFLFTKTINLSNIPHKT